MNCTKCRLSETRYNVVKGRGDMPADILFIGDAPSANEDLVGRAFIGPVKTLLGEMMTQADLDKMTTYFTNVIFCHPTDKKGGENRLPSTEEVMLCRENVEEIIKKVNPIHVILVGDVAKKYFRKRFPRAITITHPTALLRSGGINAPMFLDNVHKLAQISIQRTGSGLLPA
jgi:uracil-DNA glycosylase